MKLTFVQTFVLSLLLLSHGSLLGGANPYHIDDSLDQSIRAGFYELYNLHFKQAEKIFELIRDKAEEHPMAAFGMATVHWWRISVDVSENDPEASRPFLEAADRCIKLSQAKIQKGDETGEAHVTLGSIYGLLARWEAANRHWWAVYQQGKKTRKYLKRALEINPHVTDANMALGIFDYTVSTLPELIRTLTGTSLSADPEVGLGELRRAAESGVYLRAPANLLLASIYSDERKEPNKAWDILARLRAEYPLSPFIHFMIITTLYNQDCPIEMSVETEDYEGRIVNGIYEPEFNTQAHFFRGLFHFKRQEWTEAVHHFDAAVATGSGRNPFTIWASLYKGYALDVLGRRKEALQEYRFVLSQRPRWKSHDYARERQRKPFRVSDPELKTLKL